MSFYRGEYGRGYREGYNSGQLEYAGYDSNWVLGRGVQTAAAPYVHDRAYSSRGYYDRGYDGYNYNYSGSYEGKYRPRSGYGSSYSSNIVLYPHQHQTQHSILSHFFPSIGHHTYSSSKSRYPDEVKLKVEICCQDCRIKMLESLRRMRGVYDVRVEGSVHTMVTVIGKDLKPKKILKTVRKIIKASDYWSDWHYSDGVSVHHSGFVAPASYSPRLRH
ncbi:hypothetical protein R1flu_000540 [Riccia fluitans]|uniref:HMA domain-containing protein n=1 Tax=Riccia fluitans TaxID=41844 RepID=A0ABD1Y0S2_9MARC